MKAPQAPIERRHRVRQRRIRAGGFTLVEMLIVVVIMSVMAAACVVNLNGRQQEAAFRVAASDLAASLRFAIHTARVTKVPHRVVLDSARSGFRVELQSSEEGGYAAVAGMAGQFRSVPSRIGIASMARNGQGHLDMTWTFAPDGSGFDGMLVLSFGASQIRILVHPEAGQVHVQH